MFCYSCGMIGHVLKGRDFFPNEMPKYELTYEAWLKASHLKNKNHNADSELQKKMRFLHDFRKNKGSAK